MFSALRQVMLSHHTIKLGRIVNFDSLRNTNFGDCTKTGKFCKHLENSGTTRGRRVSGDGPPNRLISNLIVSTPNSTKSTQIPCDILFLFIYFFYHLGWIWITLYISPLKKTFFFNVKWILRFFVLWNSLVNFNDFSSGLLVGTYCSRFRHFCNFLPPRLNLYHPV